MKNKEQESVKRAYSRPEIVCVEMDNEISLALESTPPIGPDEGYTKVQHSFFIDPFKTNFS
jgi:hypothetical protein